MSNTEKAYGNKNGHASGRPKAIIVGAGIGGCASAARLTQGGFDVTVLEKNDFAGGRCSTFEGAPNYRFDQGPSLYLLPKLIAESFKDLGTSLDQEGIKLVKCEPNYRIVFPDKESVEMSTDLSRMKKEVERWEGQDGFEGFLGFMKEAHVHYELSYEHVLHRNYTTLASIIRPTLLTQLRLLISVTSTVYTRASRYFKTERMRRAFTFASMYLGMSPFDALGAYNLLQYTEHCEGILYPLGGFSIVPKTLAKIAERNGANFRFNTPVERVIVENGQAKGVITESGEELRADVVLVNADLVWAMGHLYKETSYSKRLEEKPVSCSSISFYWSMNRKIPQLNSHTIFLAEEYRESFDSIFTEHKIPHEPSFYVNVPSRHDASAAPEGKDSVIVLVPVGHISPALPTASDWNRIVDETREKIIGEIERRLDIKDLKKDIINEVVNTPITWSEKFNLHRGSILGLSHSFFNVLSFRPKTRHPSVKNAYFVGASAHPGTGVPIVLAGARLATTQILQDYNLPIPASWEVSSAELATASAKTDSNGLILLALLIALICALVTYARN
uniref:Phytoene desaturase n=1 Tax=Sporobolomyces pararoseus TaxID=5003 RepID=A0A0K0QVD9_9BASI|nr:phytoene dehydrogenase [Sporobolomyces pararoseus]UGY86998.1 phytoene desaturase [Sporobolomyces pararoseus]UGY87004.1 phytoene desaturase [synthetic construct]